MDPKWVISALLRYEWANKKMTQTILAPFQINYTVLITQLETDHPGFAEPSLSLRLVVAL